MKTSLKIVGVLLASTLSSLVWAQTVDVKDAWARATVPGQKATGVFMKITAKSDTKLVGLSTAVAAVAEVHEMKMDGDVMKMRAVPGGLDLPAGKTVELKPGGYHVMLMDLKAPMKKDSTIALTLLFKDAKGAESKTDIQVPVTLAVPDAHGAHGTHGKHMAPAK